MVKSFSDIKTSKHRRGNSSSNNSKKKTVASKAKKKTCGTCTWFVVKWSDGKSCKDMGKKENSRPCSEYEKADELLDLDSSSSSSDRVRVSSVSDIYANDKRVQKLVGSFKPTPPAYFKRIHKEMRSYLLFRKRYSIQQLISFKRLVTMYNKCQAYCNRLTELMTISLERINTVENRVDLITAYLYTVYGELLYDMPQHSRNRFVESLTHEMQTDIKRHKQLHASLKLVYDDLVQTHWTLTRLKELAENIRATEFKMQR